MVKEENNSQNQCSLPLKNNFIIRRLFYIGVPVLILSFFLIVGFQNCKSTKKTGGDVELSSPDDSDADIGDSKVPDDLLTVQASFNGKSQDHFPVGSTVDLALTPSDHQNLQKATSFDWMIIEDPWSYVCPPHPPLEYLNLECEEQPDGSFLCPSSYFLCVDEAKTSKTSSTQFQFSDSGVYDVYVELQETIPSKIQDPDSKNPNSQVSYGPRYERSLVIGKCDQSDLQILNDNYYNPESESEPKPELVAQTNGSSSLENSSPTPAVLVRKLSGFLSVLRLELNGEELSFTERQKITWKAMASLVDSSYGSWYQKFDFERDDGSIYHLSWPENYVHYFGTYGETCESSVDGDSCYNYYGNAPGITSETEFSGGFLIEAFVQLPGEECVHSAKKVIQVPENLRPSVSVSPVSNIPAPEPEQIPTPLIPVQEPTIIPPTPIGIIELPNQPPPSTSTTTTSTTQGL